MLRPRVIPCLLIHNGGLVKTVRFKNHKYVGDPINAVKIFNEKESDELIVLDIDATVNSAEPDYKTISYLASQCRMPLCYGGGIKTVEQAKKIISLGVEKVAISSIAMQRPEIIADLSKELGRQSVVVVLDIKKRKLSNTYDVWTHNATRNTNKNITDILEEVQKQGVGEIVINFIDKDGTMDGYNQVVIEKLKQLVNVPFTVLGGAGSLSDMKEVVSKCGLLGLAAGSMFVFKGTYKAVLINYPSQEQKEELIYQDYK